jgi:hypothetical protein
VRLLSVYTTYVATTDYKRMEPLWSPVVATGGNRSQMEHARKARNQAKTVAVRCEVDSGARVSPETSRGPVCKKLRLLPARVPISMQWLKMPRISPLRRMRRQGHTARVVIGVYSAASNLSGSCLGCRDGGTTARARRASESHTRGRSAGIRSRRAGVGSSSRSSGRSRKPTDVPLRHRIITSGLIHSASSRTSLGPCSAERSSVRAVTGKSTTDRRPAATSAA